MLERPEVGMKQLEKLEPEARNWLDVMLGQEVVENTGPPNFGA